ncbi:actin-associated protein FAM107A [Embiotoca jacksoni]|uniref:actin-associated protein FAM107A n=1 Tax=Embiotoca jacksoni TaxID=100190 RepID=UPI0037039008
MRLYQNIIRQKKNTGLYLCASGRHHCWIFPPHQVTENHQQEVDDLIKPRKPPNPVLASSQHRALHQELLLCHRRYTAAKEHKQREQHKQRELAPLHPPSDSEVKLRTRPQRI